MSTKEQSLERAKGKSVQLFFFIVFVLSNRLLCSGQMLDCDEPKKLCPGDLVTATCSIQNEVLLWLIETESPQEAFEIDFSSRNMVGDRESDGNFSAILSMHYPYPDNISESILMFEYTQNLNNTSIRCINLNDISSSKTCLLSNQDTPGSVRNITVVAERICQDVIISWIDPEINSEFIDHYIIDPEPACNGVSTCTHKLQAMSFSLSQLEYGTKYVVSISACSCVECGPKATHEFYSSDLLTEAALCKYLVVNSITDYHVESKTAQYKTTVSWNTPSVSCALLYTISRIEKETDSQETFNTTATNLTLLLNSRSTYNFRVAAVNGEVTGAYSSELCIYIDVPKNISNISGNIIVIDNESDDYYLLVMEWMPPVNGTCLRPRVTSYNIRFNGLVWNESKNNTSVRLPTASIREEISSVIQVYVSANNIVGEGPNSSFLLYIPSKALSCMLSGVHFTLLLFLAMLLLL